MIILLALAGLALIVVGVTLAGDLAWVVLVVAFSMLVGIGIVGDVGRYVGDRGMARRRWRRWHG